MTKPLKKLPSDLKIFFFLIAARKQFIGIPLSVFRNNIKDLERHENQVQFSAIHKKLAQKQMITADELEFLIEYERKRQWEKF